MTTKAKFEVFLDSSGEYRWRLRAANGQIVAQSEAYTTQEDAKRGATDAAETAGQVEWDGSAGDHVSVEVVDE